MKITHKIYAVFLIIIFSLYGCTSSNGPTAEETRVQDSRTFTIDPATLPFDALAGSTVEADRWWGVLGKAGYRIEVPKTWNGMLVMYAHGYKESGDFSVLDPPYMFPGLRRYLLENGYAWAASSYSKNYYDVRAGIEDTNALALAFNHIAVINGRPLVAPTKIYIIGHSMGGHVAAAAVEDETYSTSTVDKRVRYNGAVPMCGNVGDVELFNYFGAAKLAAQKLAGFADATDWTSIEASVRNHLFTSFPVAPLYALPAVTTKPDGDTFKGIMMNLTGGNRPIFDQGFAGPTSLGVPGFNSLGVAWGTFGDNGTIDGILNKNIVDTNAIVYQFDADPALSAAESAFNDTIVRVTAATDANRLRNDGLRWVPTVNGNFSVPVVTLHTLGDHFVPFKMEQVYYNRAQAGMGKDWLVQRAIRGATHCDFTVAEQVKALDDMLKWEQQNIKPAGDDVVTPETVAASNYGCLFTDNTIGTDDLPFFVAARPKLLACP